MKKSGSKSKKKKPKSRVHKWLIKNSIVYRSGRKFFKTKLGLIFISAALLVGIAFLSFHMLNVYNVKRALRGFEQAFKEGNKERVLAFLELSADNPYRLTLPDVSSLIEEKVFFDFQIERLNFSNQYRWGEVEAVVKTISDMTQLDTFQGRILFIKQGKSLFSWKIAGVESY
ncbi:MAG: hypothetical protein PVI11_07620 [Candidatus Aminicenantes bacterium]|jgi:hypothetical protein